MSEQVGAIHFKANTDELDKAAQSLDKLAQSGPRVASSLKNVESAVGGAGKSLATIGRSSRGFDEVDKAAKRTAQSVSSVGSSFSSLQGAIASAGILVIGKQFIDVADSVTTLNNQLKLATGSVQSASSAYAALFDIAQRSRVGFIALGDTYASIARAAEPLGVSQERLLKVTESIGNAMTISGGSAQGLQAALVQLGQGLSAGALRGEELNSVMEQAPRLAKALADGLGVTTGQLRALGQEGEITAEKVIKALESQSSVLRGEVAGATLTVSQAMTQLGNSTTYAIGELDKASGASAAAASAISGIASAIDVMGKVASENEAAIKAVFGAGAVIVGAKAAAVAIGGVTAALTAARVATIGFTAALAANPIGAALLTITALGAAAYASGVSLGLMGDSVDALSKQAKDAEQAIAEQKERLKEAGEAAADAAVELAKAEAELEKLQKRGAENSSNLFLREAYAHAQRLVNKLREAKREKDSLLASAASMSYAGDPYNDGASYQQYKDREKAAQDYNAILERRSGVTKQNTDDILKLNAALNAGAISESQYRAEIIAINNEVGKRSGALKESKERTTQQANAYQALSEKAAEYVRTLQIEAQQGSRLTQSQKLQIELDSLLAKGKEKINAASVAQIQSAIAVAKAMEEQADAMKSAAEAAEDFAKFKREYFGAMASGVDEMAASNDKLREEIELIGVSEEAQHAINKARIESQITVKETHLAELQRANDVFGFMSQEQILLQQQIDLLRERLALLDDKKVREGNKRAQEQMQREWDRTAQTIGDTLADYIMGGGKDAATYLKRLFSTLVLQPVVQTIVGSVMGTGAGSATGADAGWMDRLAGSGGGFTDWSTWGTKAGDFLSDTGFKAISNGFTEVGSSLHNLGNTIQGWDAAIKNVPGFGGGFGSVFGYGQALMSLSEGDYGEAIGTAIGTYILPGIGTMIGSTLGSLLDSSFSSRGANHVGGAYSSEGLSDKEIMVALGFKASSNKAQDITKRSNAELDKSVAGLASGLLGAYNALTGVIGGSRASINAAFAINPKYDDEKSYGYFQLRDEIGNLLVDYDNRKLSKDRDAAWQQYANDMAGAFVDQLRSADIAGWADDVLASLGEEITVEGFSQATQQIAQVDAAFKSLGQSMTMFADLSDDMEASLLRAFGSMDALGSAASTFYTGFYSEQERYEASLKQMRDVLASLNVSIDPAMGEQAKADFRAAVEGAFDAGNGELAAKLLGINQAFDQVASYAQQSVQAAAEAARAAAQAAADAVGSAWSNLGSMANLAAQYTGNTSGLTAQLGTARASYAGATDTTSRVAALQQIINLEQGLFEAQARARQAEVAAAQKRAEAAREQLQSVNQLLSAARNLGDYAQGLFASESSGLSGTERLSELGGRYSELLAKARGGDADAISELQGVSSSYLQLAQQMATSQADYSILSGTIAAELESTAAVQEAAAASQAARLERQIEAAERAAEIASAQFQVSTDTQKLIDSLLNESMLGFANEAEQLAQLVATGGLTVESIDSLPAELAGLLNATLVPAISGIADAARAAASAAQSSASMASAAIAQAMASAARVDGSHAGGLSYVPFDGYRAELHKGERVLTAAENMAFTKPMLQQSSNAEVVAELRALRQEHGKVVAELAEIKKSTAQFADQFDNASAGGNSLAVDIMNGGVDLDLLTIYEDAKA